MGEILFYLKGSSHDAVMRAPYFILLLYILPAILVVNDIAPTLNDSVKILQQSTLNLNSKQSIHFM